MLEIYEKSAILLHKVLDIREKYKYILEYETDCRIHRFSHFYARLL